MTDREAKLHTEIAQLKACIDELRVERDNYRTANEVFARALHALTIENDNLRRSTEPVTHNTPRCRRSAQASPH